MTEKEQPDLCETCNEPKIRHKWWQFRAKLRHFRRDIKEEWKTHLMFDTIMNMRKWNEEDRWLILVTMSYIELEKVLQWKKLESMVSGKDPRENDDFVKESIDGALDEFR